MRVSEGVEVIARLEGEPVFVRSGCIWAGVFHSELSGDDRPHRLFLESLTASLSRGLQAHPPASKQCLYMPPLALPWRPRGAEEE